MTEKGKKYLSDILMAIDLIEQFTSDISGFSSYDSDLKTQSAVERQLVIIGEALNMFKKSDASFGVKSSSSDFVSEGLRLDSSSLTAIRSNSTKFSGVV